MIKLYWQDEAKSILIREMDIPWTWDEYHKSIAETKKLLLEVGHPVIIIVDARKIKYSRDVPANALQQIYAASICLPENLLAQIIVSESKWIEAITAILKHVTPQELKKFSFVRSMEKAQKQVEKLGKKKRRAMQMRIQP
jgi:hypothetical protein